MKTIHRATTTSRTARPHRVVPVRPAAPAPVKGRRSAPVSKRQNRSMKSKVNTEESGALAVVAGDENLRVKGQTNGVEGQVSTPGAATETVPFTTSGRDAFELYLNEIGQTPLLTPEQEESLARRVQKGDEAAREQMIKANLRLVVKIAREYEGFGVPLLDLISEGNMGLIKGVERFDPDKGAKLSTYAAWWIKQNIRRALANQSKTVRLPAHVVEKRVQIRQVETKLTEILGRTPNDAEVAEELGLEAGWIRHYRQALVTPSSLDAPLTNDEDSSRLADIVADPSATTPYDDARSSADSELIHEVLDTLNDREQQILKLRFGFDGGDESTLEDIGAAFGLTRERIRQIQERALQKLRVRIAERDAQPVAP